MAQISTRCQMDCLLLQQKSIQSLIFKHYNYGNAYEAGAWPLSDGELDNVSGGGLFSSLFVDWPVDFSSASG